MLVADRLTEAIGQTQASTSVEEIFWAFSPAARDDLPRAALVVVFEDVHWAEPTCST